MTWERLGLIYKPDGSLNWSKSHAQVPVLDQAYSQDIWKVHFSTRDEQGRSLPSWVTINKSTLEVLEHASQPTLELGDLGTFDDCGVMPSWICKHADKHYMYYIGWNVRNTIAYHNSVGLAISQDGGKTYEKFSKGPLWDRNYLEPHYSGTSCVLIDDNGIWRNWYLSCTEWKIVKGKSEPRYHIKYAESNDGINWIRKGTIAIDYKNDLEAGIVKASVIKKNDNYEMYYSYRNFDNYRSDSKNSYRIGYATSSDGIKWERKDNLINFEIGELGSWDDMMIEYPHVFEEGNECYMFYNGNGFGRSGFGLAKMR